MSLIIEKHGAGFNSNSRFYERSHGVLGVTPMAFRAAGADADNGFAVACKRALLEKESQA
jgi:hypothetical protein